MLSSRDKQILGIAVPSIVSNVTVPLLGLVDLAIVGHMGSAAYIGAIAVGSMIFNVIYWTFGFLRMGTSGMTSQALGARNLGEVTRLLLRSLAVSLALACLLLALQVPVAQCALAVMKPPAAVAPLVSTYFYICVWGAPATFCMYSLTGWFIGMQNTRVPMIVSILQNVVNIIASLCLVYLGGMKIEGVAAGTLIAQWFGVVASAVIWAVCYGRLLRHPHRGVLNKKAMTRFFGVNRDIFLRTLCLVAVNLFFLAAGARQGELILSANAILMTMYTVYSYFMDGFAYAGEALCGKYLGAGNAEAFSDVVRRLFRWGLAMIAVFTAVYVAGGKTFLRLLTNNPDVVAVSGEYMWWACAVPLAGMAAFIYDGIFVGITATRGMLVSSAIASALFFALFFVFAPSWANHALWMAFIVYLATRGAVQHLLFRRMKLALP